MPFFRYSQPGHRSLTAPYSLVQAAYWMNYCVALGFAAVYLQALGYTNTQLGTVVASGHLLSAVLGPSLAARIDKSPRISAKRLLPLLLGLQACVLIVLMLFPQKGALTSLFYALYICFSTSVNTLNLKLYSDITWHGLRTDYGFTRGIGSLAYVLTSVVLGLLARQDPVHVPPVAGLVFSAFQLTAFLLIAPKIPEGGAKEEKPAGRSLLSFVRANRLFCLQLAGTVLIYFAHNTIYSYLINITRNVGGDTATMGFFSGYMAAIEIPVMLLFTRLFGKKDSGRLLCFAFIFFVLKSAAIAAAHHVWSLSLAFLLQAPSFALYTAAIVPYVQKTIAQEDAAKAQSLTYTVTVLGSVLASLLSGRLYDRFSVFTTLRIACAVCLAGAGIAFFAVRKRSLLSAVETESRLS